MERSDGIDLLSGQNLFGKVLLEPDGTHVRLNHTHYRDQCALYGRDLISFTHSSQESIAVVAVGAGLMMATCDELSQYGLLVHCCVDVGGLSIAQMAQITEWCALSQGHSAVVLHTWHSLSSAGDFSRYLALQYPDLIAGRSSARIYPCIKGLDDQNIPAQLVNYRSLREIVHAMSTRPA
jgi:hypothetical protein